MEPLQADQDEAMAWIEKGQGLTDTDVSRGHLWCVWSHCGNVDYLMALIWICFLSFTAHSQSPPPLVSLLSLFFPFTCITLPSRSPSPLQATEKEKESPVELTERCFRELLGRAAYGNIKNAVTPVLMWVSCLKTFVVDASKEPLSNWVLYWRALISASIDLRGLDKVSTS